MIWKVECKRGGGGVTQIHDSTLKDVEFRKGLDAPPHHACRFDPTPPWRSLLWVTLSSSLCISLCLNLLPRVNSCSMTLSWRSQPSYGGKRAPKEQPSGSEHSSVKLDSWGQSIATYRSRMEAAAPLSTILHLHLRQGWILPRPWEAWVTLLRFSWMVSISRLLASFPHNVARHSVSQRSAQILIRVSGSSY